MPTCHFTTISEQRAYILWRIDESEAALIEKSMATTLAQTAYQRIQHPSRRKEWLAARLALKELLEKVGYAYTELQKDAWGRPYLVDSDLHLSIAHCTLFAFAALDRQHPIGVDIQLPCKKLKSVKEKFLADHEADDGGSDLEKLCIYWCAKEAIYKACGGQVLSLKQDIRIQPFAKSDQGTVWGAVGKQSFTAHYDFYEHHVLVWAVSTQVRGNNK